MLFPIMPLAASAIKPQGLFGGVTGGAAPQGQNPFDGAELPIAPMDLSAIQTDLPDLSKVKAERPRRFLGSDEFYQSLLRGGASLLSGGSLADGLSPLADGMDTYRKRQLKATEYVDPSKYVRQVTDPETGEVTTEIDPTLQAANHADLKYKNDLIKPLSMYQQDQSQRGWAGLGQKADQFDRRQAETERANQAREGLLALGYDLKAVNSMLSQGLAYSKEDASVPDGYEVPTTGGAVPQAPRGGGQRPQSYGGGIESLATSTVPGVRVTSRERSAAHNRSVGGVSNSFHTTDDARDFTPPAGMGMGQLHSALKAKFPGYDVINEGDHVHIEPGAGMAPSARRAGGLPAPRMLRAPRVQVAQSGRSTKTITAPSKISVGTVINGRTYKGGALNDRNSWS